MRLDLHLHSTASDGGLSPAALVDAARAGRLDVIALTDHDTTAGVAEAQRAGRGSIDVIAGIELSSTHGNTEVHMLGYFVDTTAPALVAYTDTASRRREARMHAMIERLAALGIAVDYTAVLRGADADTRSLGRPHLARALVEAGHADSIPAAFDRFIGNHAPAYIPIQLLSAVAAIALIHEARGLAVWAHPPADALEHFLDAFVEAGLDGVECLRPRVPPAEIARLEYAARRRGLLVTGGSDWHGPGNGRLGEFAVAADDVAEFLERGGI